MDAKQIIIYALTILANIGVVAAVRRKAQEKGRELFFARGRGSFVLLFALCFAYQLVMGDFTALDSVQGFVNLIQQTSAMVATAMGAHTGAGLLADGARKLK